MYLQRLKTKDPTIRVTSYNLQRLLLVSVMLAHKYLDDLYYSNKYWARIGGVTVKEINHLEATVLQLLDWKMHVSREEYLEYLKGLLGCEYLEHLEGLGCDKVHTLLEENFSPDGSIKSTAEHLMAGGFLSPHSCNTPGFTRKTWNGQQGEQRCRTCMLTSGASHGIDARQMAAAGAKPAANSTSAAPSSTAKPAASSPFGAAAKPATQGAFGGGFGATTTGTCTIPPLVATTAASPFGAAVKPLTSRRAGPEKSARTPAEASRLQVA
jgi:hypothetical protein